MIFIDEEKRSELPDSEFGIESKRKFPLNTAEHVRSAIKLFGHAEEADKKHLAKRIASKAKSYGIEIPETSQLYKYLHEDYIEETCKYPDEVPDDIIELLKQLNSYEYGIVKNGKKITDNDIDFFNDYKSLSISEFEKYKIGVCWDYVHYEANWFKKNGYRCETFYIQVQDEDNNCPSHTYLVFYLKGSNTPYYFESSWEKYAGIEKFNNISELHNTVRDRHIKNAQSKCYPNTYFREKYNAESTSLEHLTCGEYVLKVTKGKIKLESSKNNYKKIYDTTIKGDIIDDNKIVEEATKYDPPYSADQVKTNYGDDMYNKLVQDPAHTYRMNSGIELIHREPSKKELERIWKNWNLMTTKQKSESDKKSIELFGKTNKEHYKELISTYDESAILESSKNNYKKIYDITIKMFKDSGRLPNADNRELKQFLATGKTDEFGGALCIAGLGTGFEGTCSKINKEIKPLGGRIHPDNYGTAMSSIKEDAVLTDEDNDDLDLPSTVIDPSKSIIEILDSVSPKNIYITSDWHIFKNHYIKEKNHVNTSEIISWCKENIKDDNVFLYLGDMSYRWINDKDKEEVKKVFKSLPGIKILVIGNHDEFSDGGDYEDYGFKYAVKDIYYKNIIFSHRPIDMSDKPGMLNIHGHKHHKDTEYHSMDGSANVNVYPSFHNNKPITLDRAIKHKDYYMRNNKRSDWSGMGESTNLIEECIDMIEDQLNREDYITEDATLVASVAFLVAIFGMDLYSKLSPKIDKFKKDREYAYYISDKEISKQPKYGYSDIKFALCNYAYYTLNINKSEKNTLIVSNSNKSNLNKHVYAYKFNKNSTKLVEDDTFENLCKKHNINIKEMDDSKLSDRKKVYNQALKLFKDELKNNKDIISKGKWGYYEKDDYDDFIDGRKNYTDIYSCDLWKLDPQARTNYGSEEQNTKIWDPIINAIKVVNDKLPKGYKIESDGDWDDIYIVLYHNEKIYKEWAMNACNPIIGIQKPYVLKAIDNTGDCINSKLYALSPDIISDKYLVVDENSKLAIVDKSYFDNYYVEVYEYIGNRLNIGKIKEMYDSGNIVSPNYIYETLSGKHLLTQDQIDFDDQFKKVDFSDDIAKMESYRATMQSNFDKINGAFFYIPAIDIQHECTINYKNALDIMADVNGYYLRNRFTHERTESVSDVNQLTEAMIKSISVN